MAAGGTNVDSGVELACLQLICTPLDSDNRRSLAVGRLQEEPRLLWAELRRDLQVLLVPSMGWEMTIISREPPDAGDQDIWEDALQAWRVTERLASALAEKVERQPAAYFGRSIGSQDVAALAVGTVVGQTLDPAAAQEEKQHLLAFLRGGAFTWRFITL